MRVSGSVAIAACLVLTSPFAFAGDATRQEISQISAELANIEYSSDAITRSANARDHAILRLTDALRRLDELARSTESAPENQSLSLKAIRLQRRAVELLERVRDPALSLPQPRASEREPVVMTVRHPGQATPPNNTCDQAIDLIEGVVEGTTIGATDDGDATCGGSADTPDVWFRLVVETNTRVWLSTEGSNFDTVLSVHTGCPGTFSNQVSCNDDTENSLQSEIEFVASPVAGGYLVRLSGAAGAVGTYRLEYGVGGSISGHVVSEAGDALPGVTVVANRLPTMSSSSVTTGDDGSYTFEALSPAEYVLRVEDPSDDFASMVYDGIACSGPEYCPSNIGDRVTVTASTSVTGIDFHLPAGVAVSGTVVDEATGEPIWGATVLAITGGSYTAGRTYTDADGSFSVRGLAPGTFYVHARDDGSLGELFDNVPCNWGPGTFSCTGDGTPVVVTAQDPAPNVDFALARFGAVVGRVINEETGAPLAGACVKAWLGEVLRACDTTGSDGGFELGGLDTGSYTVSACHPYFSTELYDDMLCFEGPPHGCDAEDGTPIPVVLNETTSGIEVDLPPRGEIRGSMVDAVSGEPLHLGRVELYYTDGLRVGTLYAASDGTFSMSRLDSGRFFAVGTSAGYDSEVYHEVPCNDACDPLAGDPIDVAPGTVVSSIDFALDPQARITGHLTDSQSGAAVRYFNVECYRDAHRVASGASNSVGDYELTDLDPGSYVVLARDDEGYLGELYDDIPCWPGYGCAMGTGTLIEITGSETVTGIDFQLDPSGSVAGTVLDAETGIPVHYVDEVAAWTTTGFKIASVHPVYDGDWTIGGIPPGDLLLTATASTHGPALWQDVPCVVDPISGCDTSLGTPVTVALGQHIDGIEFHLHERGTLRGSVLDSISGSPIPGATVRLLAGGGWVAYTTSADDYGLFEFYRLPATSYGMTVEADGRAKELYDDHPCLPWDSAGCRPASGDLISIPAGGLIDDVRVVLDRNGSVEGNVSESETGWPLPVCTVKLWDALGRSTGLESGLDTGRWTIEGIPPGRYFAATSCGDDFLDELFDDIPCLNGPPLGCNATKGHPLDVLPGAMVSGVDFGLELRVPALAGRVVDARTGDPIPGLRLDLWSEQGYHRGTVQSTQSGRWLWTTRAGTWRASTHAFGEYIDQVFDGVQCPDGPAATEDCDILLGSPIPASGLVTGIDFVMDGWIFRDGFESGASTGWSEIQTGSAP